MRIGGMGAVLRENAGAEGSRRAADGSHEGCAPGQWRRGAAPREKSLDDYVNELDALLDSSSVQVVPEPHTKE